MPFDGTENPIRQLLLDARSLIEKGWCQGQYRNVVGYCVIGAIAEANRDNKPVKLVLDAIHAFQDANDAKRGASVWNDEPGRTQQEVLDAFDKTLELL